MSTVIDAADYPETENLITAIKERFSKGVKWVIVTYNRVPVFTAVDPEHYKNIS